MVRGMGRGRGGGRRSVNGVIGLGGGEPGYAGDHRLPLLLFTLFVLT